MAGTIGTPPACFTRQTVNGLYGRNFCNVFRLPDVFSVALIH
jgi:hypothetical protein